jgi:hypothetical protein
MQLWPHAEAIQLNVLCLVDDTHSATTELLDDAIMRDGLANHRRECYVQEQIKSMKPEEMAIT